MSFLVYVLSLNLWVTVEIPAFVPFFTDAQRAVQRAETDRRHREWVQQQSGQRY